MILILDLIIYANALMVFRIETLNITYLMEDCFIMFEKVMSPMNYVVDS